MHGMCGTLDADLEVQCTSKRAELTAFLGLRRIVGATTSHVDNEGIIEGLWRGEIKCIGSMLICGYERFVTEGNGRADELAKDGAMLDGGDTVQIRASTVQQRREEVCSASQHAASLHC